MGSLEVGPVWEKKCFKVRIYRDSMDWMSEADR